MYFILKSSGQYNTIFLLFIFFRFALQNTVDAQNMYVPQSKPRGITIQVPVCIEEVPSKMIDVFP